ncbi:MAG: coproporphyrinogen III oxidase [Rhodospirillales bacterium 20-64-7]|nr:MAG: coproporphyrinogen III oxidase [Rhodospirillales bacterium 20-64-7]HQT78109.1 radical SAM family heme chaperone HemW [Rhodopila sp.]
MVDPRQLAPAYPGNPAALTDDLALYVHWPFCLAKCPYCDFNSHVRDRIDQDRFASALRRELATEARRLGRRRLTSVFFGGGTPSLMDPRTVAALLEDASQLFDFSDDIEITLEANPTSIEASRLADFRSAGVNRASVGIQSLDESALKFLGRKHSAAEAIKGLAIARKLFPRVSFDLIYARPGQDVASWRAELRAALAIASDHLSLYQLTIEPATPFEALYRHGQIILPDEDLAVSLYNTTEEECARAGLLAYEVSNYARPGQESRHNLTYWRYRDYAGIGPGAHGRILVEGVLHATRRHRAPEAWADRVDQLGHGLTHDTEISGIERAQEALLMGLRLREGIDLAFLQTRTGCTLQQVVDTGVLSDCVDEGYLELSAQRLVATRAGRIRLDALLSRLLT